MHAIINPANSKKEINELLFVLMAGRGLLTDSPDKYGHLNISKDKGEH